MMLARSVGSRSSEKSSTGDPVRRACMHVERHRDRADRDQAGDDRPRQQIEAGDRQAEGDAGKPDAGQHQPVEIEALGIFAPDRIDVFHAP